jgi:hypothetical protein
MVQLGGLEPPTSCSTDRRSNQLSYSCIGEPRGSYGLPPGDASLASWDGFCRERTLKTKSPACAGLALPEITGESIKMRKLHCTFMVFDMPALIGSAVSVATFWASAERVFACTESDSNCLRMWVAESSTASASVFELMSSRA